MKVLIIEDEIPAANNLIRELRRILPEIEVAGPLESIKASLSWLEQNPDPDLIFMDINLTDGPSFEIFEKTSPKAPVIFCTAYDEYALKAFKLNSIDYLLKPLEPKELQRAIHKYQKWVGNNASEDLGGLLKELIHPSGQYKQRFVVRIGDQLKVIKTPDVQYFTSSGKDTFLCTGTGVPLPIEESLDRLEGMMPKGEFFRINRNYLLRLEAIEDVRSYSKSRLKVSLINSDDDSILVSRDKTSAFKSWLAGE